jgi:hypothetical protein
LSTCPNCTQGIQVEEKHYGTIFTCPNCRAVFYIGWDGSPEVSEQEPAAAPVEAFEDQPVEALTETTSELAIETAAEAEAEETYAEVSQFANASESSGPLTYHLQIKGLELADTFEKVREAMTDSRFGWDVDQLMSTIHFGELRLNHVSPTKAAVLVGRIKGLPIEISWKQEVYSVES